jgi:hypothetical protein
MYIGQMPVNQILVGQMFLKTKCGGAKQITRVGPSLALKYKIWVKMPGSNKHSSLLRLGFIYQCEIFIVKACLVKL